MIGMGKVCRVCKEEKAYEDYYAKPSCRDGLDTQCKVCYKAKRNAQAVENRNDPEYVARRNEQSRRCKEGKYDIRYATDAAYHGAENKRSRDWRREKYNADEVYREAEKMRSRDKCNIAYATDPAYRIQQITRQHDRRVAAGSYTVEQWSEILEYFEYQCAYCGETHSLTVEHVKAVSKGGTNYAYNLIPACAHCNGSKGAKDIVEWYSAQKFYSEYRLKVIFEWYKSKLQELVIKKQAIKEGGENTSC